MEDITDQIEEDVEDSPVEEESPSIPPREFVGFVTQSPNLAAEMSDGKLMEIARDVVDDYNRDKSSMADWLESSKRAIELAKLVKEEKNYPHSKAANVKYPLVTSAALQFNARAYPAIVPSQGLVKSQVHGSDRDGHKAARGERVADYMSFQLLNIMDEWEEETDSLLVQLPIVGTMYRKVWYDPVEDRPRSRLLDPGKLIINDNIKSMGDAPRATEELDLFPDEIAVRIRSGQFVEFTYTQDDDKGKVEHFIEQHCRIDLDDDGYEEPYIVTVHLETETVVKVVADFAEEDVRFEMGMETYEELVDAPMVVPGPDGQPLQVSVPKPVEMQREVETGITAINRGTYFVPYRFMPSLDGKWHGTGLGIILGDISASVNTIINMLLDAGHMSSLGGGFIGSEFRLKGGSSRFEPGEWKMAKTTGGLIKDSIVPMTFPGPDAVLFQMLGMLIDAGKEISSTKDIMTGDSGGKVQTATTTLALIEQGMMVFSAAYKRIFRSLKKEYKLITRINAASVDAEHYNAFHDDVDQAGQPVMHDPAKDFGAADMDIQPVADPNSVTKMQEMAKAQLLKEMAAGGLVNPQAAGTRILEAAQIGETEELTPQPDPEKMQAEKFQMQMTLEMMKADLSQKMVDIDQSIANIEKTKTEAMKNMADIEAKDEALKLDKMKTILKERRDGLEQTLRIGLAGMAAESRNRGNAAGNRQGNNATGGGM